MPSARETAVVWLKTLGRAILGALLGMASVVLWLLGPTLHVLEVENATAADLPDVLAKLVETDVSFGDVPAGQTAARVVWRWRRRTGDIVVSRSNGVLGRCGYIGGLGATKTRIKVTRSTVDDSDCEVELRFVGRPW